MNNFIDIFRNPPLEWLAGLAGRTPGSMADGFIAVIAFIGAILFALISHEYAHGYVAYRCGDPTAKVMGRLSFNPKKHLDPIGTLSMLIIGVGWAKPVPINPVNFTGDYRRSIFLVSIAGVTVNIVQCFVYYGLYMGLVLLATAIAPALQASTVLYFLMYALIAYFMYGISLNCGLFLFNLIPLYPLDGSRVFELIVGPHSKAAVFMRNYGRYILWGLILLGFIGIDILGAVIQGGGSIILGGFGWFWEMIFGLFGV